MKKDPHFEVLQGFIVFEGLDGSGTTTQSRLLHHRMEEAGLSSFLTCEPTENFIGKTVRQVLQKKVSVAPGTLAKLFAADRHNHLYHEEEGILSLLRKGTWVISDRYLFSSLAYQSVDWDFESVWSLNCGFPLPEHLVFLDILPEEGQRRIHDRNAPVEIYEKADLQDQIRANYFHAFSLFEHTKMKLHIFDASLSVRELEERVWKRLELSDTRN
jgi:dTMP kinase